MTYYVNGRNVPIMGEIAAPYIDKDCFELLRKSMLTGGRKFSSTLGDDSGTSMYLFREILSRIDSLDIIGYGFNDIHINDRIDQAMILNPNLKLNIARFANTQIPHSIERHNHDKQINYSYGFRTPHLLHYMVTNIQKHPEEEKLKDVLKISNSQDEFKTFLGKYLVSGGMDEAILKYTLDAIEIMQKTKVNSVSKYTSNNVH